MEVYTMELNAFEMYRLFIHRKDVFARQLPSGIYVPIKRPVTLRDIEKHLRGEWTLGAYCLDRDNTVIWACVDLDGHDLKLLDRESQRIYEEFEGYKRMREFSGRRGYHVWIFFDEPVYASYAKQLVRSRLRRINANAHEVFPKQTTLNETRKYGNLVKLPLALHQKSKKFSKILEMET